MVHTSTHNLIFRSSDVVTGTYTRPYNTVYKVIAQASTRHTRNPLSSEYFCNVIRIQQHPVHTYGLDSKWVINLEHLQALFLKSLPWSWSFYSNFNCLGEWVGIQVGYSLHSPQLLILGYGASLSIQSQVRYQHPTYISQALECYV